ncbi:hypothetical protein R3P38DRAFT_2845599 [Favolaschia claudopus]|uniref:Uncharacterized protein n=1 Tax=Favolaschia claudopus TaxID=2862362 RepID=A0AAW0DSM2_9AGAR
MVNQKTREWMKHVLWISRVKLIYARITLTRYTTLYFFIALTSCFVLVGLQLGTYASNTEGATAVAGFLQQANISTSAGMSYLQSGDVVLCHGLPGQEGANCKTLVRNTHSHMHVRDLLSFDEGQDAPDDLPGCALSLMWLQDVLQDARREDLGILVYNVWLLTLSVATLLNESLPHLFAGLAARALAAGWSGFRVKGTSNLYDTYLHVVETGKCRGFDPLGDWWTHNTSHEIISLVFNAVLLVLMGGLTYKLFRVYALQSFSRVGASPEVNRVYKLVLLLSVVLQLAGFFTLGQTALWMDKIAVGAVRDLAEHFFLYLAELIVTAVLVIPWLVLGWISVRRESKPLFLVFSFISLLLIIMSTMLFTSPLNRFVIKEWSFYATMSISAYILLVATLAIAIVCRLHFGKGLAHFLRVTEALEGEDFTAVNFPKGDDAASFTDEKSRFDLEQQQPVLEYSYSGPTYSYDDEKAASHIRKPSKSMSAIFSEDAAGKSPADTIHMSSSTAMFMDAMANRMSMSPVVVKPGSRTASIGSNDSDRSRHLVRADSAVLPPSSLTLANPLRSQTIGERPTAVPEPTKPVPAAVRSGSVPMQAVGLPRRPSDGKNKPPGNYF